MPLPCIRTLQSRLQHIQFSPGLLNDIFKLLQQKTSSLKTIHKDCVLVFDEMAIQKKIDYNPGTKSYVGWCTLPGAKPKVTLQLKLQYPDLDTREKWRTEVSQSMLKEKASKIMMWILGGLAVRWKQPVAYDFTGNSFCAEAVKDRCLEVVRESYKVGLIVRVLTCDMGNRHVWKALGIEVGPQILKNSFPHPCIKGQKIFVMADVVHAFKNFKEMLTSNKVIHLPDRIVQEQGLPSSVVKIAHILALIDYQSKDIWQMTPNLKRGDVQCNHFDKMKLNVARRVINHRTASGIFEIAFMERGDSEMVTTGWMILLMHEWFCYVTSRSLLFALNKKKTEAYEQAVATLKLTIDVFQHMYVPGGWKPVQTAIKISTKTILDLAELCLNELSYDFLFTGRLTQDIIENVFSIIRYQRPIPTPLQVTQRLRQISISMLLRKVPGSSYDFETEGEILINIFEELKFAALDTALNNIGDWPREFIILSSTVPQKENKVLYRIAGYVVYQVFKVTKLNLICSTCSSAVLHKGPEPHPESQFTRRTNYTNYSQVEVSDEIFTLIVKAEECFRGVEHIIMSIHKNVDIFLKNIMKNFPNLYAIGIPNCHNLATAILNRFIQMRLKIFTGREEQKEFSGSEFGSRSMVSRLLANNIK